MIKKYLKRLFFYYKAKKLKKQGIVIEANVSFKNTIFFGDNRICSNTSIDNSVIGKFTYTGWNVIFRNAEIGAFCSIAPYVEIIYGSHPIHFVSTHPIFYSTRKQCGINFVTENKYDDFNLIGELKKSVIVGNDVWIGYGAKILEGICIEDGAVILAGAIVTKDVAAYSIVGGVPSKHIKYRFNKDIREKFLKFKWWEKDIEWIRKYVDKFRSTDDFLNLMKENV